MEKTLDIAGIIIIIVLLLIFGPMIAVWGLNTLSEQSNIGWYIPHNLWTYLALIYIGYFGTLTRILVLALLKSTSSTRR